MKIKHFDAYLHMFLCVCEMKAEGKISYSLSTEIIAAVFTDDH